MTEHEQMEASLLARLAGIPLPDDRLTALAARLKANKRIAEQLTSVHFGEAEPAARFLPPPGGGR